MRLQRYISRYPYFEAYLHLLEYLHPINEMSDDTFQIVQRAAAKLGLRAKKSEDLFTYLKRAGSGVNDLFRISSLFLLTDLADKKTRAKLVKDAKKILKRINKKELTAFLMQLDRGTFGLTAHIRHILMSFFGIEVATYNNYLDSVQYINKEIDNIKYVLKNQMGLDDKSIEWGLINRFEDVINNWTGEK